jgi:hypothetical protein
MKKVLLVLCSLLIVSNAFAYKITRLNTRGGEISMTFVCNDGTKKTVSSMSTTMTPDEFAKAFCKSHGGLASRQVKVMFGKNSFSDGPKNNNSMPDPRFIKGN